MRKLWVMLTAAAIALCATATRVSADQIVFKNGDKLTGTIKSIDDGKITINTAESGDVKVDAAAIETFSTDEPITLRLSDGTTINRKIEPDANGQVQIVGGLLGNQHLPISSIDAINPPSAVWKAEIKFGGLVLRGNTSSESVNFGLDVSRTTEKDIISFDANYLYGRTKDRTTGAKTYTADNWDADAKYEYNFTKKFYGFAEADVSRDRLAFQQLRFNPSAGVGYRWFTKPIFSFATEGGIAWVYEDYTNGTPRREDVSLKLAYHLTSKLNDYVMIFHDLSYFPSLENGNVYIVNTDAGLRATVTKHFFTEFKFVLDYDSQPAIGALKTNTRYQLDVGYSI
jgi:putative salt-induced outer membrane protein YdiY